MPLDAAAAESWRSLASSSSSRWRSRAQRTASCASDGWKPPLCRRRLDRVDRLALHDERERAPCSAAGELYRCAGLTRDPFGEAGLDRRRQPAHVTALDRRQRAADRDGGVVLVAREVELAEPAQALDERRVLPFTRAETECRRGVGDRQLHAVGRLLEPVGEVAHEQQRGGPERRQPERLRVPGAGIVTQHVEYGVGPGGHADRSRHLGSPVDVRIGGLNV